MKTIFSTILILGFTIASAQNFNKFDKDKDGKLSHEEAGDMLRKSGLLQRWDSQKDGFLSLQEWSDGVESTFAAHEGLATYGNFMKWDANADHYVNTEELAAGLFNWMDENNNEFIEAGEWKRWQW